MYMSLTRPSIAKQHLATILGACYAFRMIPTPVDPIALRKPKPLKTLGVRLDHQLLWELEKEAAARDTAPSTLARGIIADWLKKAAKK